MALLLDTLRRLYINAEASDRSSWYSKAALECADKKYLIKMYK